MCTVAVELNLLNLAPLLHDDFLWLKAKKIPLYLYSTTSVSALIKDENEHGAMLLCKYLCMTTMH